MAIKRFASALEFIGPESVQIYVGNRFQELPWVSGTFLKGILLEVRIHIPYHNDTVILHFLKRPSESDFIAYL